MGDIEDWTGALSKDIERLVDDKLKIATKLQHSKLALRVIAATTTDEKAVRIALAALDVIGDAP